ncbi:MAG: VCBS repeat-containing protein [Saprospiraceae bacterium]|nr:VCBS repeat-containing protein [Saprospiraceae bacterium]
MKNTVLLSKTTLLLLGFLFLTTDAKSQCTPKISASRTPFVFNLVSNNFNNIDVGTRAVPTVADIDNNGRLDLWVGAADGKLYSYEQQATNSLIFDVGVGSPVVVHPDLTYSAPHFTDLTGNGLYDMLMGTGIGQIVHLEQAAVNSRQMNVINNAFPHGLTIFPPKPVPTTIRFQDGGSMYVFIGDANGTMGLYYNLPGNTLDFYSQGSYNLNRSGVASVLKDIDKNGFTDMLVGFGDGTITHYEMPNLSTLHIVSNPFNGIDVGDNAVPTLTDLDGDGLLDLLIGKDDGTIAHYEQAAGSFEAFTSALNIPSQAQSIKVWGDACFTGDITATASAGFQVSLSETTGFGSSVTIPRSGSTVSNTTVYVRYNTSSNIVAGSLQLTAANAASKTFGLAGSLFIPPTCTPTVSASNDPSVWNLVSAGFNGVNVSNYAGPTFADLDADGLLDLLVGKQDGTLSHYEQASANSASFNLVSNNFNTIDVGEFSRPFITDLDGDYLLDLLIGEYTGGGAPKIAHYRQSAWGNTSFTLVTNDFSGISVAGTLSVPTITDIDNNGKLDLIVGLDDGTLNRYEQAATNSLTFSLITTNFGSIDVGQNAEPTFTDFDGDGLLDLFVGNYAGTIYQYEQASANGTTFNLVTTAFKNIDVGANTATAFADIDHDGLMDMFVGVDNGAIDHYEQTAGSFSDFNTSTHTPSATQTLQVWGSCLSGNATVAAPAGYEVSLNASSGFGSSVSLPQTNGDAVPQTVYVRLGSQIAGSRAGNLTVTASGSNTATYALNGTVAPPCNPNLLTALTPSVLTGVTTNFSLINTPSFAAPTVVDVDGNGLLDLFVGKADGQIARYRQSSLSPEAFFSVTSSFASIDVGNSAIPTFTDIDNDGLLDLVVGNSTGNVSHYEQSAFGSTSFDLRTNNFNNINVGSNAAPVFNDLDRDGLLDMLVGSGTGNLYHYRQAATNSTTFNLVTTSFNGINVPNSVPAIADIDNDGSLDLVVGKSDGQINHYKQAVNSLIFNLATSQFSFIDAGDQAMPTFTDIDNDGYLDMLAGNSNGTISYYKQTQGSFSSFSLEPANSKKTFQTWGENCLTNPVTVTAPTGFEVSLSPDAGFASSLTITPSNGEVADKTVYVRFNPSVCSNFSGDLVISSPDASSRTYALTGSTAYTTPTITTNNGLHFDGVDDYVYISPIDYNTCSASPISPTVSSAITIEYWFKGTNLQSAVRFQDGNNYIVAGWNGGAGAFKHILSNSGGTVGGVAVGAAATDGNWHHIAMTWQRNTTNGFKSYLDGQLVAQTNTFNTALPNLTGLYLGSFGGASEFMNGTIDEVRVWNVVRTQTEIQAGMNADLSLPQTGLLMYYKFNHGTANSNNATATQLLNSANTTLYSGTLQNFALNSTASNWVASSVVLPIELLSFKGQNTEGGNLLTWTTAEEKNAASFDIERSTNSQTFEKIGEVKAKGSHSTYELMDDYPLSSIAYYRLKIKDLDGQFAYSKTISIEKTGKTKVKIYPSVTSTFFTIENAVSFEIVNAVGQVLLSKKTTQESTHDIHYFPNGIYFIRGVDTEGGIFSQKIIKQY